MSKQIKFVDGIYGFIYNDQDGWVSKIFTNPVTEAEISLINEVLGKDYSLFVRGDEKKIMELWNMEEDEIDVCDLDININEKILEWDQKI